MNITKPTKQIKNICHLLGDSYRICVIDLEQVIYRDYNNGYDLEISGLNHNIKVPIASFYVWYKNDNKLFILESISNIK